jgi:hypothetical protein
MGGNAAVDSRRDHHRVAGAGAQDRFSDLDASS